MLETLKKIKERFKIRTKYDTSNTFVVDNFIYIINESIRTNLKNTMNLIRVLLSSMKRSHCRILYDKITASLSEKHDNYPFSQFFPSWPVVLLFLQYLEEDLARYP